jgi:hypothetical protein
VISNAKVEQRQVEMHDSLLLKVVLPGAAGLAAGEWAFMVSLSSMHPAVACEMPAGGKAALACGTLELFLATGVAAKRTGCRTAQRRLDGRQCALGSREQRHGFALSAMCLPM